MKRKFIISLLSVSLITILYLLVFYTIHFTNENNKTILNTEIVDTDGVYGNYVLRCSENRIYITNSLWAALHEAIDGDTIIFNGCFNATPQSALYPKKLTQVANNLSVIGIGDSIITVTQQMKDFNYCSMNFRGITNLYLKNIKLKNIIQTYNNNLYGLVVSGSQNVLIDNCIIQSEIYGTNNNQKTFVAVTHATNTIVRNSTIISIDMTGSNEIYHTATHNAEPTLFRNCKFIAGTNTSYTVGKAVFQNCKGNIIRKSISPLNTKNIKNELLGNIKEINKIYKKIIK